MNIEVEVRKSVYNKGAATLLLYLSVKDGKLVPVMATSVIIF